ncbi:MAG: hypothetical protein UY28_C0004G0059 [Candidatus Amesbacteria bacterium GW2011_GWB1_48_13]|uniref:Uncharacterized protein n=1 Tax=Candidatus Amesbacteria bacterium GW2011_GWB1_48_13 TaxID=1618362 RepID=A0A0G1UW87_9BACT|nr:MAG: hypothetical protein UY28_C0004G0059 [Candidatus Amesbacteria bacterium GW2011_GWB1_48_13]
MAKKDEVLGKILASKGQAPQGAQSGESLAPQPGPDSILPELEQALADKDAHINRLLNLLIRIRPHIAIRNGMGQVSKEFCTGCQGGHKKNCPMPQILAEIEE